MPRTIVFDVNETLLDLSALDSHFERIFGDASVKGQWFKQVLQSALVMTILGNYTDFGSVGGMALDMTALREGVELAPDDRAAIRDQMLNLPPHPEVPAALQQLKGAGFRLAALTNSAQQAAVTQLTNAGLAANFDMMLSVEAVQRFKPAAEVYNMAADKLGEGAANLRMVAAHDWDVAGAMNAGWRAAFVARPGMVIAPQADHPDIIGADMAAVVAKIIEVDG